ncbi:hypothetical protein GH733_019241, partial [Mirounga leonina]
YIIVTIEEESDGGNDDDIDVVIIEDSETELTENTIPTDGMLTIEPNCRASNDNYRQLSQMTYGIGGLPALGDQAVPQMNPLANLKRYSSNSVDMELLPLHKRGRTSFPRGDNMSLQELIENTNKQVNNLCGIISKMQPSWEKPPLPNCEDGGPSGPVRRQENHAQHNPVGIALQPAMLPELQELALRKSPPPPKIVSTYSLHPSVTPGSPGPGLAALSYIFSEGGEGATRDLSSAQPPLALPAALLSPGEPRVVHAPEMATCPTVWGQGGMGPGPASSAFCIPPSFVCYQISSGNDSGSAPASSSLSIPPNFGYLGDPKRNVRVLNVNLVTAQKKNHPRHAARYLVHVLFSKEILMHSWVGVSSQGRQPLDPNKMAAIREYLATNFPNHDLRECGKDWKTCIADINSLIYSLCAEASTTPKAGGHIKGPTSLGIPASADVNHERGGKGGESSSQLSQPTAASETRKGNSQHEKELQLVEPEAIQGLALSVPDTWRVLLKEFLCELMNPIPQNILPPLLAVVCHRNKLWPNSTITKISGQIAPRFKEAENKPTEPKAGAKPPTLRLWQLALSLIYFNSQYVKFAMTSFTMIKILLVLFEVEYLEPFKNFPWCFKLRSPVFAFLTFGDTSFDLVFSTSFNSPRFGGQEEWEGLYLWLQGEHELSFRQSHKSGRSHKVGHSGARLLSDLLESRQVCPDDVSAFMEGLQVCYESKNLIYAYTPSNMPMIFERCSLFNFVINKDFRKKSFPGWNKGMECLEECDEFNMAGTGVIGERVSEMGDAPLWGSGSQPHGVPLPGFQALITPVSPFHSPHIFGVASNSCSSHLCVISASPVYLLSPPKLISAISPPIPALPLQN